MRHGASTRLSFMQSARNRHPSWPQMSNRPRPEHGSKPSAAWIGREGLGRTRERVLSEVWRSLMDIKAGLAHRLEALVENGARPDWIGAVALADYLRGVSYDLGPDRQASLLLFGHHCRELGLLDAVPGLRWQAV